MNPLARIGALALLTTFAAGCTVGPDFRVPDPPPTDRYVPGAAPEGAHMPRLVPAAALSAQWWTLFGNADLDALVRRALAGSPSLAEATARLTQAQELRAARAGATTWPQVDASFGAVRQRIDPATFGFPAAPNPGPFNVFSLGADVAYNFDLFGGARRELEALGAEVDYQGYELEAARLTLATQVATTAIRRAALAAQVGATESILATQQRQRSIVEARFAAGGVAWLDVQNQRARVAQTEATLPPLRAQWAHAGHLLAVLLGEAPGEATLPDLRLTDFRLPADIPLTLPSGLARQRPDIRAAEALLHKASANVGVATADLYPKLVVSGSFSSSQLSIADVLGSGINVWSLGANLLEPLFRGGELQARKRAAEAAYQQAAAGYRKSVLGGLQDVADVLRSLEADGQVHAARAEEAARAREAWQITAARFEAGGVSQYALLDADRNRLQAELGQIEGEAARLADAVALFQALGGGWQDGQDSPASLRVSPEAGDAGRERARVAAGAGPGG